MRPTCRQGSSGSGRAAVRKEDEHGGCQEDQLEQSSTRPGSRDLVLHPQLWAALEDEGQEAKGEPHVPADQAKAQQPVGGAAQQRGRTGAQRGLGSGRFRENLYLVEK